MTRTYWCRGQRVTVEEWPDLVAVRRRALPARLRAQLDPGAAALALSHGDRPRGLAPFRANGWSFGPRSMVPPEFTEAAFHAAGDRPALRVYESAGQITLGPDRIVVRLRDDVSLARADALWNTFGVVPRRALRFAPMLHVVSVAADAHPIDVANALADHPDCMYAEPEMIERIPPRAGDPDFLRQWHLHNRGVDGGLIGADIAADAAWPVSRGKGSTIAIIDIGFHLDLKDLSPAVLDESAASFHVSASGDAQVVLGRDGIGPDHHGTFCAGMALARADNDSAGRGVAPEAGFIPIALRDTVTSQVILARAISYAVDPSVETNDRRRGADVISCSLGISDGPWLLRSVLADALAFARKQGRDGKGTPVFWAVADSPTPIAQDGVCASDLVLPVSATDRTDHVPADSGGLERYAFGPELKCVAPGFKVFGLFPGGLVFTDSGTSYAAPCAAGVAALMIAANPQLTQSEVASLLGETCDRVSVEYDANGHNDHYGDGRINAARAVQRAAAGRVQPNGAGVAESIGAI